MKIDRMATYVLTIVQVPICLILLIVACLQLCFAWLETTLIRWQNWLLSHASNPFVKNSEQLTFRAIAQLIEGGDDAYINTFRQAFEDSYCGRLAIQHSSDRHLYAVLKPTRAENMKRIENVVIAMDPAFRQGVLERAKKILKVRHAHGIRATS